jgi:hypothetical protein
MTMTLFNYIVIPELSYRGYGSPIRKILNKVILPYNEWSP